MAKEAERSRSRGAAGGRRIKETQRR